MQDISTFDFKPVWDLSLVAPKVVITNQSIGTNLAGCHFWFIISSGGGTVFHQGSELAPDKDGVWANFTPAEDIPLSDGHVEWSGGYFSVTGYVKNSIGEISAALEKKIRICRPAGNKTSTANNYGVAILSVENLCNRARVSVMDNTNYSYNGLIGIQESKVIKLYYPADGTGVPPSPGVVNNVNNALFPISQNGDGYRVALEAIYLYETDGSAVRIKYKFGVAFRVSCNIDLCPLACAIRELEEQYEKNGCTPAEREKMILINSKMNRALIAKAQPLCDINVEDLVEEIKKLGGFQCNCSGTEANSGLNDYGPNSVTPMECVDVLACVNNSFNDAAFYCLAANQGAWEALSLPAKISRIAQVACDALNGLYPDPPILKKYASFTLALTDLNYFLDTDTTELNTITIPPHSAVPFPLNVEIPISQGATGVTSFVAGLGVTIQSQDNFLVMGGQFAAVVAKQVALNVWRIMGNLKA